jgi:peptide deformylase
LARVIQHEYDHLNGIVFIEKITDMKQCMSSEEYAKRIVQKKK